MSSAKVHVVITDHERENSVLRKGGTVQEVFRFSGYVVGNPAIRANGKTEEDVLSSIKRVLVTGPIGRRKIVEVDVGDLMVVQDVMET